jgi:hypothetical protein
MNANISRDLAAREMDVDTGRKTFHGMARRLRRILPVMAAGLIAFAMAFPAPAWTQDKPADNMQILREKIKADKKLLVATNMDLTESEAKDFWPLYDQYQQQLEVFNQRIAKLIESYAAAYRSNSMRDETAKELIAEFVAIEKGEAAVKAYFVPKLSQVLPPRKVARYLQIENKIRAAVKFQLADEIPLVP